MDDRLQEDPTRQVHLGPYDDLAVGSEPASYRPGPPITQPLNDPHALRRSEEPTRSVHLDRGMSEVDWDLD
jgi:hypothetical protein